MIRFLALVVGIAAVAFIGLQVIDNDDNLNGVEEPDIVLEDNVSEPVPVENNSSGLGAFPQVNTSYSIGPWTVVVAEGERSGFDSNWTLQAGIESSNSTDRNQSIIYNCIRSYNFANDFNPMYENASNPCQELNMTLQSMP